MAQDVRVDAQELQHFATQIFTAAGMPPEDAALESEVLVWANLRGIDSHGVLRIPWYVSLIDNGQMNPRPQVQTLQETPAVLYLDADRALGPVATVPAMQKAIQKAKNVGIGWTLIRNVTHQGAMGYYAQMAAQEGMAGLAIVCSPPNMAPFGARAAGLHNSPVAMAVPAGKYPPLSLDMATSVAAGGKLSLAQDKGIPLGEGWALDSAGNPTVDPHAARILLPSAGPKGSGLALMFQTLTSLMANNPLLVPALRGETNRHNQNSLVAAINISLFTELETFTQQVDETIEALKALPKVEGVDAILMPGEPEFTTLEERSRHGIPVPPGTLHKLQDAAARFDLRLPESLG
jgi:ureidoglycolate dehydrogenase (NAD+)